MRRRNPASGSMWCSLALSSFRVYGEANANSITNPFDLNHPANILANKLA
jgi:hypothetical protein